MSSLALQWKLLVTQAVTLCSVSRMTTVCKLLLSHQYVVNVLTTGLRYTAIFLGLNLARLLSIIVIDNLECFCVY